MLVGKEDVFNHEPVNKSAIEREMLQSTKIEFKIRFSTLCKDASCRIREGRKLDIELSHALNHFKTGAVNNKKLDDLQRIILPNVSKEYLKNA